MRIVSILQVQSAWKPHDAGKVLDRWVRSKLFNQRGLPSLKIVSHEIIAAPVKVRAVSGRTHHHGRRYSGTLDKLLATANLLGIVGVDKESTTTDNVLLTASAEVGLVDRHEDPDLTRCRVECADPRPHVVQRSVDNFSETISAIAEELEREVPGSGIKDSKELSSHRHVVRWQLGGA